MKVSLCPTVALRLEVGFPHRYGLLWQLRPLTITSTAASPVPKGRMVKSPTFTHLYSVFGFRLPLYACPVSPDTVAISRAAYTPVAVADLGRLKIPFHKNDSKSLLPDGYHP